MVLWVYFLLQKHITRQELLWIYESDFVEPLFFSRSNFVYSPTIVSHFMQVLNFRYPWHQYSENRIFNKTYKYNAGRWAVQS